ncbi:MAG: dynamin family protein [Candidatus Cloacimonadaceae bacterium]|nr:dynamin family protein [Candidatus Cloacimonadaceae bacterium]
MKTENMAKRLDELLSSVRNLQRYVNVDEDLATFVFGKKALVNKLKNPEFNIVFLGSFSSGKSTLINALLEMELLPESAKATTAVPTFIRFRDNVEADKAAKVSFLNVAAKNQLRDLYIDEITKQYGLKKLKESLEGKSLDEQVAELDRQKKKATELSKSDTKLFDEFKKLLNGWENKRPDVFIPIDELGNYVAEDNDDILFVDKVDINVQHVKESIDPRIVLVDLPGLGVSNPRHREFMKRMWEQN